MKMYIFGINIPNSGSKLGIPKIIKKMVEVNDEEYKTRYEHCLYGEGNTPEEAREDAEKKLERLKKALCHEFGEDFIPKSY